MPLTFNSNSDAFLCEGEPVLDENGEPVWEWLGAQAGVSGHDLEQLRYLHACAHSRRRVDLVRLQNCLAKITVNLA